MVPELRSLPDEQQHVESPEAGVGEAEGRKKVMAGSFNHLVGPNGGLRTDLLDHLGDASEALEDCYALIYELAGGDSARISAACQKLGLVDPWATKRFSDDPMPAPMQIESRYEYEP